MSAAEGEKPAPDWERIEVDYRAGVLSLREIAAGNGINRAMASIGQLAADLAAPPKH